MIDAGSFGSVIVIASASILPVLDASWSVSAGGGAAGASTGCVGVAPVSRGNRVGAGDAAAEASAGVTRGKLSLIAVVIDWLSTEGMTVAVACAP